MRKNWKWRHAKLVIASGQFEYFDGLSGDMKGNGMVAGVKDVASRKGKRQSRFDLVLKEKGKSRTLAICTETEAEKANWIAAVQMSMA